MYTFKINVDTEELQREIDKLCNEFVLKYEELVANAGKYIKIDTDLE